MSPRLKKSSNGSPRPPAQSNFLTGPAQSPIDHGGSPLPQVAREYFEPRMGYDFSHVRVHTDRQADFQARMLNARAFTSSHHITFADNEYSPHTSKGQKLLAHELAHVIQQENLGSSIELPDIQRDITQDVLSMSIAPSYTNGLSDQDISRGIQTLQFYLSLIDESSPLYQASASNLQVLQDAATSRSIQVPTGVPDAENAIALITQPTIIATVPILFEAELISGPEEQQAFGGGLGQTSSDLPVFTPGTSPLADPFPEISAAPGPAYVGPALTALGLSSNVLASGDLSWVGSRGAAARRVLSTEYWSPLLPRRGTIQLDRLVDQLPRDLNPLIVNELNQLDNGMRVRLSWERRGFTQEQLRQLHNLIRQQGQGLTPAQRQTLERAIALHSGPQGASSPGSPIASYMRQNHPLDTVGARNYRVRVRMPANSAIDISGPSAFNDFGGRPDLMNIGEAEFVVGREHGGQITSVQRGGANQPSFLMRHSGKIRWGGRAVAVAGLAYSGYRIGTAGSAERTRVIGEEVLGNVGGIAGTALAVAGCVALGVATGGVGLFICGLVGGFAGGMAGTAAGGGFAERIEREYEETRDAVQWASENSPGSFFVPPGTVTLHGARGGFGNMLRTPYDVVLEMQREQRDQQR